jgi:hypothetical protein
MKNGLILPFFNTGIKIALLRVCGQYQSKSARQRLKKDKKI